MTVAQIAKEKVIAEANITAENINSWIRGHIPKDRAQQRVLEDYIDKKTAELMEAEMVRHKQKKSRILDILGMPELNEPIPIYENKSNQAVRVRVSLKRSSKPWPVNDPNAITGSFIMVSDELEIILDKFYAPSLQLGDVDGAIEMVGDSMNPTYKNGDRLIVSKLEDPHQLDWNATYLIVCTDRQILVKRILQNINDPKTVILKSDNQGPDPYPKLWENILAVFKIKGVFVKSS